VGGEKSSQHPWGCPETGQRQILEEDAGGIVVNKRRVSFREGVSLASEQRKVHDKCNRRGRGDSHSQKEGGRAERPRAKSFEYSSPRRTIESGSGEKENRGEGKGEDSVKSRKEKKRKNRPQKRETQRK